MASGIGWGSNKNSKSADQISQARTRGHFGRCSLHLVTPVELGLQYCRCCFLCYFGVICEDSDHVEFLRWPGQVFSAIPLLFQFSPPKAFF